MCAAHGITLNPKKTLLGFSSAKMLGREVSGENISVHDDNLKALRECAKPQDTHELRSFLGICAYAMKHVKNYAGIASSLHHLTKKGIPWKWSKEVDMAYLRLKSKVLEQFKLHVPDDSKPLYLFTDASEEGMGAHLCQLKNPVEDADLSKVKDEDKLTIAFYSASFDLCMQRRPVYYREAKAVMWGLEKAKEFIERNPHTTVVATDHSPLQWVKQTNKGVVSAWLIEDVAETDFRVVYVPGKTNTTADALSRAPLVSPSKFNLMGASQAWDAMLKMLPDGATLKQNAYVWSAQHTANMQRKVQAWRAPRNPINVKAPKSMLPLLHTLDLILVAPAAEEAPVIAHEILKRNPKATTACLIPTDLVTYVPSEAISGSIFLIYMIR